MNIQVRNHGNLIYAQIDGLYSQQEISEIKTELVYLETVKENEQQTLSAISHGVLLKVGGGVFLEDVYRDRKFSTILKLNRKIFDAELTAELSKHNCFFNHITNSTHDETLVNFYGSNNEYKAHKDTSIFTALTFFHLGSFSGGEFVFDEHGISIDPVEGRVVVFPGCVLHSAKPVIAEPKNFRVTMAQFINYRHQ